jgi:hypothetical protein
MSVQIRRLKQETSRKKKKIRDKEESQRKDNTSQNKLYPKPNDP